MRWFAVLEVKASDEGTLERTSTELEVRDSQRYCVRLIATLSIPGLLPRSGMEPRHGEGIYAPNGGF